jgi:hypothetical protein
MDSVTRREYESTKAISWKFSNTTTIGPHRILRYRNWNVMFEYTSSARMIARLIDLQSNYLNYMGSAQTTGIEQI